MLSEQRTSGSQILHSKTRRVKFNETGIVSGKPTNRKKVMDHRGCNKNVRKTKRAMSTGGTHGRDRKTRPICDHNGRRKKGRRANREYTRVGSGVVSGSRVGDPLWPNRRCGAEVGQGRRVEWSVVQEAVVVHGDRPHDPRKDDARGIPRIITSPCARIRTPHQRQGRAARQRLLLQGRASRQGLLRQGRLLLQGQLATRSGRQEERRSSRAPCACVKKLADNVAS